MTLTWDEVPCINQRGPILGHVIKYTTDGRTTSIAQLSFGHNEIIGLTSCTRYKVRIAAQNDAGIGPFSPPLSLVTTATGKCLAVFCI